MVQVAEKNVIRPQYIRSRFIADEQRIDKNSNYINLISKKLFAQSQ